MTIYSQFGDEKIIQSIFERIGTTTKRCCEFGAIDGLRYSNTAQLIREQGWCGTFIESEQVEAKECRENYVGYNAEVIEAWVTAENVNSLVPANLDFLCIDIDGNDYWVWKVLESRPRVVMIEINLRKAGPDVCPYDPEFTRAPNDYTRYGASKAAMIQLGEDKDYHLAAEDQGCNLFFVGNEFEAVPERHKMGCQFHYSGGTAVFVHIPKTGGHFVERSVKLLTGKSNGPSGEKGCEQRHLLPIQMTARHEFRFSFVRHPLAWYASWYKYQMAMKRRRNLRRWKRWGDNCWHPMQGLDDCWPRDGEFETFIKLAAKRAPSFLTRLTEWYLGPPGWQTVDFVGQAETLLEDMLTVFDRLGMQADRERLRAIGRPNASDWREPVWTPFLEEIILGGEREYLGRYYKHDPRTRKRGNY